MSQWLTLDRRKRILEAFAALPTDADGPTPPSLFLPLPMHALALRSETVVVLGDRGAGKSALFQLTRDLGDRLGAFFDDPHIAPSQWLSGFAEGLEHPPIQSLEKAVESTPPEREADLRAFWAAHLLRRLTSDPNCRVSLPDELTGDALASDPAALIEAAGRATIPLFAALDAVERDLEERDHRVVATYDALDRIGNDDARIRQRLLRGLLSLWLSAATRYRRIRAKIFLRPDMLEEAEYAFADASKLRSRAVRLEWDVAGLYRLLARQLANTTSENEDLVREWLEKKASVPLGLHRAGADFGWMPAEMSPARQRGLAVAFAGEVMGAGEKKGAPVRWIPARLPDAAGRIAPRSFLRLFRLAAESGMRTMQGKGPLVRVQDLTGALAETSRRRAAELKEDYRVVGRLEGLSGATMPMERRDVTRLLAQAAGQGDRFGTNGADVVDELCRVGVLLIRSDGRIDVPDIYRHGFDIKRKGGAAQPR